MRRQSDIRRLELAADAAASGPARAYRLGAVAVRADGAVVWSHNGAATNPAPQHHAEARVLRKAGRGAELYVVRIGRNGKLRLAKPCKACRVLIKSKRVVRCVYSLDEHAFEELQWDYLV